MKFVFKVALSILAGVITTGILNWAGVFNNSLNVLIGIAWGLVVYLSLDGKLK